MKERYEIYTGHVQSGRREWVATVLDPPIDSRSYFRFSKQFLQRIQLRHARFLAPYAVQQQRCPLRVDLVWLAHDVVPGILAQVVE
jgi:hypothetical protein